MANKRRSEPAIPADFERFLSGKQLEALAELKLLGWHLEIIRRPKFEPTEVILRHRSGKHCLLKDNGELDYSAPPKLRRQPVKAQQPPDDEPDPWANANDDSGFEAAEVDLPAPASVGGEPVPRSGGKSKGPNKFIT